MSDFPSPSVPEDVPFPRVRKREAFPFWDYGDLAVMAGLAIPCLILGAGFVIGLQNFISLPGAAFPSVIAQFLGYFLWFALLYALFRRRYEKPFWESLRWHGSNRALSLSMMLGPAVAMGGAIMYAIFGASDVQMPMESLLADRSSVALIGAFATTLGPLCEELAFRGFLMPLLTRSVGRMPAVALAAVPFALVHGFQYAWAWQNILIIWMAGVCFGLARALSGSTAAATFMHATYNLTIFAAFLMQGGASDLPW
jgi:hypothetical protein